MMATARRCSDIVARLEALGNRKNIDGMRRYGITGRAYWIRIPELRRIASEHSRDHDLAMALLWSQREEQYVRRAGYVLMAMLAVHRKEADEGFFTRFFPAIIRGADGERRHVKQAVSWALSQIGKRGRELNEAAISAARDI